MSWTRKFAHDVKWRFHQIFDAWHDRRLGIDASGITKRDELQSSGPNARHSYVYLGTPHLVLNLVFRRLRMDTSRFTFVDLGSGKGRVILRAAAHRFKRVEGVELSPAMHRIALENVDKANVAGALRSPVIIRNEDAVQYDLPKTPLVIFFFNSFERIVLTEFLNKLGRSLHDCPRECYFIYVNPRNGDCLAQGSFMREMPASRLARAIVRLLSPWPLALYRSSSPANAIGQRL